MQFYEAILSYNNSFPAFTGAIAEWTNPQEGVIMHKIFETQALAISTTIKTYAPTEGVPITVTAACLAIESRFDPLCENHNIGKTSAGVPRSNPNDDPMQYDMGIAQLKLMYLLGEPGVSDFDSARAYAFDLDKSIARHCRLMASKIAWATSIIQNNQSAQPDPRLSNAVLLGTGAYNFGNTGMLAYYNSGAFPSHCQSVIDLERYFASAMGTPSVFS
jgi:hypothetical protein